MKTILINSILGILAYLVSGMLFYGYHPWMLPSFLLAMGIIGYVRLTKKSKKEAVNGLLGLYVPVLLLLLVTGFVTNHFLVIMPYCVFALLMALLTYGAVFSPQKILVGAGMLLLVVGAFFSFDLLGISHESFDASSVKTFYQVLGK